MKHYFSYFILLLSCFLLSGCSISFSAEPSPNDSYSDAPAREVVLENGNSSQILVYTDDGESQEVQSLTSLQIPDEKELSALLNLDNTMQSWGYNTKDRDSDNRPNGCVQYQNRYGSYNADFLRENEPTIYLTFDEGYENGYTGQILDVLKDKKVSAVFFVTMPYVKENPDLIQRMIDEGHVVGSHSVTHPESGFPSLSLKEQAEEMVELHNYIKDNFSYEMNLFRYPKGMFSEQSMALLQTMGYRSVFWSFAYKDWITNAQPSTEEALEKTLSQLHNGAIYLLHAVSSTNTTILPQFIDSAREKGYEFGKYEF